MSFAPCWLGSLMYLQGSRARSGLVRLMRSLAIGGHMSKYWLVADEGIRFTPSGENTAYTEFADTVPREMTEHSRTMDAGIFEIIGKGVTRSSATHCPR